VVLHVPSVTSPQFARFSCAVHHSSQSEECFVSVQFVLLFFMLVVITTGALFFACVVVVPELTTFNIFVKFCLK
jgi:hypothetical protein